MSDVLARVQELVARNEVRTSLHGFRELAADGILLDDLLGGIEAAVVIGIILMQHEDRLCWSCRKIPQADLFMSFGVFAEAARVPQFW